MNKKYKSPIVLVDVDLTVVDVIPAWIDWLQEVTGVEKDLPKDNITYDITSYWRTELDDLGINGLGFWKQNHVYDNAKPIAYAKEALDSIYIDWDCKIRFVSVIKGNHGSSKYKFLKKHFPYLEAVLYTREKWCVEGDILVDDRIEYLEKHKAHKILIDTPYVQRKQDIDCKIEKAKSWTEVYDIVVDKILSGEIYEH